MALRAPMPRESWRDSNAHADNLAQLDLWPACPNCGDLHPPGTTRCPECGKRLTVELPR